METSQEDFEQLKNDIEDTMDILSVLQRKYRELTGKEFIKPFRLSPFLRYCDPLNKKEKPWK